MNGHTELIIFIIAFMLIIGVWATKFSTKLGLPSLVLFLIIGMGLNRIIFFDDVALTQFIGTLALIVILFDGGTQTKWGQIKPIIGPATSLSTIGVLITTTITGLAATYILGFSLLEGMLFGAIVGSTDAAAVFSVLGNKNIKGKLKYTLEAESGSNDPMAVFLTITLIEMIQIPEMTIWSAFGSFFLQMGLGLLFGYLFGKLTVFIINGINLENSGLYPILAMGLAIFSFIISDFFGGSGLLTVYVMALFVGNNDLMYRYTILRFNEGFALMMQIIMFTLLGLLVFPKNLLDFFWQGILLTIILMFVARPVAVFISMAFMKFKFKDKLFISWAGLKGAVPIVLATYPIIANIESYHVIFNVVFFVVFISALVQGSTLSWLAEKLHLTADNEKSLMPSLELIQLGRTDSEIMEIVITDSSPAINLNLISLELPEETLVIGIVRNKKLITPTGRSMILAGDTLYVLSNKKYRDQAKQVLIGHPEKFNNE